MCNFFQTYIREFKVCVNFTSYINIFLSSFLPLPRKIPVDASGREAALLKDSRI